MRALHRPLQLETPRAREGPDTLHSTGVRDMTTDHKTLLSTPTFAKSEPNAPAAAPVDSAKPIRLLRIREVLDLVGLKKATVYQLHRAGQFPRSVKITSRAVGWVEEEVQQWLAERRNRRS